MRPIILVALLLSACQSTPSRPLTIGECLEQRGDGMLYTMGQPHEFMYNSLTACETEIAQRKARESSPQQRN